MCLSWVTIHEGFQRQFLKSNIKLLWYELTWGLLLRLPASQPSWTSLLFSTTPKSQLEGKRMLTDCFLQRLLFSTPKACWGGMQEGMHESDPTMVSQNTPPLNRKQSSQYLENSYLWSKSKLQNPYLCFNHSGVNWRLQAPGAFINTKLNQATLKIDSVFPFWQRNPARKPLPSQTAGAQAARAHFPLD